MSCHTIYSSGFYWSKLCKSCKYDGLNKRCTEEKIVGLDSRNCGLAWVCNTVCPWLYIVSCLVGWYSCDSSVRGVMEEDYWDVGRSYYAVLGVSPDSSEEGIRRAYRKLAMQWHPDKWTRTPSLLGEAKKKFQQIQGAYSVLSDPRKRTMYDAGLYDPDEEEDEGFADFLQEMVSLMDNVRKENKVYTMEELQGMFWEMAQGFETTAWSTPEQSMLSSPQWFQEPFSFSSPATSSGFPWPGGEKSSGVSERVPKVF